MRLTLMPTSDFVSLRGATARIWTGETSAGTRVSAIITGVAPEDPQTMPEFREVLMSDLPEIEPLQYTAKTFI